MTGGWHALIVPAAGAAAWGLSLLFILTWLAGRHWITAWLGACVLLAAAWGFVLSLALGPADLRLGWDPTRWAANLRHDAPLVLTWADPLKPWQLCAIIGGVGLWCKLVRSYRKRAIARACRRVAVPEPHVVPVVPVTWPQTPPVPASERRGGRL